VKLLDLLFPPAATSYRRARVNEARSAAARSGAGEIDRALAALATGKERFLLGTLADGRPVRMAPEQIGRHGMVWGASGAGKSYFIQLVMEGFASRGRRAQLIDPKGETVLIAALQAAAAYLRLAPHERDAFAARFRVIDVRDDRLTPMNLFAQPA
jgi:DNA helicase HerA-like ATPase